MTRSLTWTLCANLLLYCLNFTAMQCTGSRPSVYNGDVTSFKLPVKYLWRENDKCCYDLGASQQLHQRHIFYFLILDA